MKILDRLLGRKPEVAPAPALEPAPVPEPAPLEIDMNAVRLQAEAEQAAFEAVHRVPYAEDQRLKAIEQRIALILKAK